MEKEPEEHKEPSTTASSQREKRKQVKRACTQCRRLKKACSETFPCERCIRLGRAELCTEHSSRDRSHVDSEDEVIPRKRTRSSAKPAATTPSGVEKGRSEISDSEAGSEAIDQSAESDFVLSEREGMSDCDSMAKTKKSKKDRDRGKKEKEKEKGNSKKRKSDAIETPAKKKKKEKAESSPSAAPKQKKKARNKEITTKDSASPKKAKKKKGKKGEKDALQEGKAASEDQKLVLPNETTGCVTLKCEPDSEETCTKYSVPFTSTSPNSPITTCATQISTKSLSIAMSPTPATRQGLSLLSVAAEACDVKVEADIPSPVSRHAEDENKERVSTPPKPPHKQFLEQQARAGERLSIAISPAELAQPQDSRSPSSLSITPTSGEPLTMAKRARRSVSIQDLIS